MGVTEPLDTPRASIEVRSRQVKGSLEERAMSPIQVTPENANSAGTAQLAARPLVIKAADVHEVMREQLDLLIEHAQDGVCGCEQCERYSRVRAVLMELFSNSSRAVVKLNPGVAVH